MCLPLSVAESWFIARSEPRPQDTPQLQDTAHLIPNLTGKAVNNPAGKAAKLWLAVGVSVNSWQLCAYAVRYVQRGERLASGLAKKRRCSHARYCVCRFGDYCRRGVP